MELSEFKSTSSSGMLPDLVCLLSKVRDSDTSEEATTSTDILQSWKMEKTCEESAETKHNKEKNFTMEKCENCRQHYILIHVYHV